MQIDLGDGVRIRRHRPEDLEALVRHANDPEVSRHLRDRFPHPYTHAAGRQWLDRALAEGGPSTFAIAHEDELIGGIGWELGEDVYARVGELGYWLGRAFWNRGIVTAAVRAIAAHAFATDELIRLEARVYAPNAASARVLEKAGFRQEGRRHRAVYKHGRVLDELVFATWPEAQEP